MTSSHACRRLLHPATEAKKVSRQLLKARLYKAVPWSNCSLESSESLQCEQILKKHPASNRAFDASHMRNIEVLTSLSLFANLNSTVSDADLGLVKRSSVKEITSAACV